ncbi:hypothetical protein IIA16_00450 [bacterium]|nr:hypothetical protein [bacterium]
MAKSARAGLGRLLAVAAVALLATGSSRSPERPWTVDDMVLYRGGVLALSYGQELYWWDIEGDGSLTRLTSAASKATFIAEREGVAVASLQLGLVFASPGSERTWIGLPGVSGEGSVVAGSQVARTPPAISRTARTSWWCGRPGFIWSMWPPGRRRRCFRRSTTFARQAWMGWR